MRASRSWAAIVMVALCGVSVVSGAEPGTGKGEPSHCAGFRGNGTGVWPADCTPVTTWNETDFKKVESGKDARGRPILTDVADKENRKNIVWKTPLPMYCNSGMTLAGGKMFLLADPGGIGFSGTVKPDFLGVRMYCLDARNGKQLWTEDLHHIDLVPAAQQEKLRAALTEVREFYSEALGVHIQWQRSWDRGHGNRVETNDSSRAAYARIAEKYRKYISSVPATLDEVPKYSHGQSEYVQVKFENMLLNYRKDIVEKKRFLAKFSYRYNDFFGQGSFIECAFATPVSDGKRIYAITHFADAYCCDFDGKLVWKQWYDYQPDRMVTLCSPMIYGDLLVFAGSMPAAEKGAKASAWMAVDKNTGKPVWRTPKKGCRNYAHSTPSYHRLATGGDTVKPLEVLWCPSGQVLRLRDGKVLAEELGCHGNARPWAVDGDILAIENGSGDGGAGEAKTFPQGTVAFRLKADSEDKVTAEQLWVQPKGSEALCRMTARNGSLYGYAGRGSAAAVHAVDLRTGKAVAHQKLPPGMEAPQHLTAVAGQYLFGLSSEGQCSVFDLGLDGRQVKAVGVNRLGTRAFAKYDFFNQGAQPTFSGNRIFIRSYTDVYCIGDPGQPTRLSETRTPTPDEVQGAAR